MKVMVVGFGSIGQRHARLLGDLGHDVAVVSRRQVEATTAYSSIAEAVPDFGPDYAVIASRTHEHRDDVAALAETGFAGFVLVEKPLFDRPVPVPDHTFEAIYVAFQLRFHPVVRRLKALLDDTTPHAVHAYVGQDLRDWRPGMDYRQGYSAHRAQGGGVLRDLSHELDYLIWMLGGWTRLAAAGGHLSSLEIDSDDVFSLVIETPRCPVTTLNMNYLDSTLRRQVLALTDKGTIMADLVAGTVAFGGETETFTVARDDPYTAQHRAVLAGETEFLCSAEAGLAVVAMIDAAERAAAGHAWESV